jgi:hypothetical protein
MPQAVEVKGQAQQQRLADLQRQAAARCFGREFTFDHREDRFYLRARPLQFSRKSTMPLVADFSFRDTASWVGADHAVRPQRRAHVAVICFGVARGVGQHHADGQGQDAAGRMHQAAQIRRVTPRAPFGPLRQDALAIHVGDYQPLQKVPLAFLPVGLLLHAAYEVGADTMRRESRAIHSHRRSSPSAPRTAAQSAHRFSQHARDSVVRQPPQETLHRGVVGHARQSQHAAQLRMFPQAHRGFAEDPVLVTHQAEDRQHLGLREWMFAETRSVRRQNGAGHLPGHVRKGQQSDLWQRTSCASRKQHRGSLVFIENGLPCRGCQQSRLRAQECATM